MHRLLAQQARHAADQPLGVVERLGHQVGAHRHGHLGGSARRGRAAVRGEVDQGRVGLMANGGDQRDVGARSGAHHDLLVERPQVLQRAAAARHDQYVGTRHRAAFGQGVEAGDGAGHLARRLLALDRHRPDQHVAGEAVAEAVQDVANDGARRRGHDTHHLRQVGQRAFAVGVEQALGLQFLAPVLEQLQQRALAGQFQPLDDDLVARGAGIGGELAGGDDLKPLLDLDAEPRDRALPADAVDHGVLVLEAEVAVARAREGGLADLAAHAHPWEGGLDLTLEGEGKLGNREFRDVRGRGGGVEVIHAART